MAFNEQAAQFLHIPTLNLKEYKVNYNLSYSKNKKGLRKSLREKERNRLGDKYKTYPSELGKFIGTFIGLIFVCVPCGTLLMSSDREAWLGIFIVLPLGALIMGAHMWIAWEMYFWRTLSKDKSYEKLTAFFEKYWIELSMLPNIAKILEKIYETEVKLDELKRYCGNIVEMSELSSIHPENLMEAEGGIVVLDIHIEFQEVTLEFYRALDQAFFDVKTSKEQSEEVQKALSAVGEEKTIEKAKYLKRLSRLEEVQLQAEKIKIDRKFPQSAIAEYEHLLSLLNT